MMFSFIVIARNMEECAPALESLHALKEEPVEVIVALGTNPSQQRNEAAARASGRYLVFLDNDSRVDSRLLHYYRDAIDYSPSVKIVGGPSLYDGRPSLRAKTFQSVFASVFGLGPFRSRYVSLGRVREASERELILCNLLVERELFLTEGGFHLDLYPNEENEFITRVRARAQSFYHPLAICRREAPLSLGEFSSRVFRYGRGRAKHLVMNPSRWNLIFLIALAFSIYVIGLSTTAIGLTVSHLTGAEVSSPDLSQLAFGPVSVALFPIALYGLLALGAASAAAFENKRPLLFLTLPPSFFICHFFYGLGLLYGLSKYPLGRRSRARSKVDLRVMTLHSSLKVIGDL